MQLQGQLGARFQQSVTHMAHWQQQLSCSFMTYTLYQASWRGRVSPNSDRLDAWNRYLHARHETFTTDQSIAMCSR